MFIVEAIALPFMKPPRGGLRVLFVLMRDKRQ